MVWAKLQRNDKFNIFSSGKSRLTNICKLYTLDIEGNKKACFHRSARTPFQNHFWKNRKRGLTFLSFFARLYLVVVIDLLNIYLTKLLVFVSSISKQKTFRQRNVTLYREKAEDGLSRAGQVNFAEQAKTNSCTVKSLPLWSTAAANFLNIPRSFKKDLTNKNKFALIVNAVRSIKRKSTFKNKKVLDKRKKICFNKRVVKILTSRAVGK